MRHDEGASQPTGHAQSPLSSAFPIIILLDSSSSHFERCMLMGTIPKRCTWIVARIGRQTRYSNTLANSLHGMYERLCSSSVRGEIWAFSSSDEVLAPLAVRGISSMAFCAWLTS